MTFNSSQEHSSLHHQNDFDTEQIPLELLWQSEESHFWFASRNDWILRTLRQQGFKPGERLLEVGCGSGGVAKALWSAGADYLGIDTATEQIKKANERLPSANFLNQSLELLDSKYHSQFDWIGFFDVLEHLDQPEQLIRESLRFAKKGARIIATVPAQASLYSMVDEGSGHKKRYDRFELKKLFIAAGLVDVQEYGFFRWMVPFLKIQRSKIQRRLEGGDARKKNHDAMVENLKVPPTLLNGTLKILCRLELVCGGPFSKDSLGASQIAVGVYAG